jgi:redox-sensitive bicupin YhaK (pirin superfamily)
VYNNSKVDLLLWEILMTKLNETTIKQVVKGMPTSDGAGVKLKRVLGQPALQRLDPFLMLDEFGSEDAQDYIAGFPKHPHRGFQTVTYMLNGKMGHKDSVGLLKMVACSG